MNHVALVLSTGLGVRGTIWEISGQSFKKGVFTDQMDVVSGGLLPDNIL